MTEEQLQEHGYPRSNPEAPGRAVLYNLPEKKPATDRASPHSVKRTDTPVSFSRWLCSQLSTKYAADVAQNTRSTPTATVSAKRNVAFTGDSCADKKVRVFVNFCFCFFFYFFFFSTLVVNRSQMLLSTIPTSRFLSYSCWRLGNQLQVLCCDCGSTRLPSVQGAKRPPPPSSRSRMC